MTQSFCAKDELHPLGQEGAGGAAGGDDPEFGVGDTKLAHPK